MEMESSDCDSSFFEQKNIFIALTYKCNAFCRKCITRYNRFRNQSMQRSDCRRLAELLIANHFSGIINLGSGESLLYDELPTFVERVLSELPQVTKSGYKLAGWYTDSNYKNEFDINKSIDSNLVLYAKWEKLTEDDKVTVSFVLNVNNEKIDSIELVKGNTINLPSKNIN